MYLIKELPKQDRPRERLLEYGESTMQSYELIAIILRTGAKERSVLDVSKELLYRYRSLKELASAPIKEYTDVFGVGTSKALELKAAFELGRRSVHEPFKEAIVLNSPETIYRFLKDQYEMKTQEHLIALYVNTKGILLQKEVLFIGSLNSSLVHPREIFKHAVYHSAAGIILVHNHPSGDPTPSSHDMNVTTQIHNSSVLMDIPLLDHIIIGRDRYFSFKEKGVI